MEKGVYNINVTWAPISAELQPIYYNVTILPLYSEMLMQDDAEQSYDGVSQNATGVSAHVLAAMRFTTK